MYCNHAISCSLCYFKKFYRLNLSCWIEVKFENFFEKVSDTLQSTERHNKALEEQGGKYILSYGLK